MDSKVTITASFWGGAAACITGYIIGYTVVGPVVVRVMGW